MLFSPLTFFIGYLAGRQFPVIRIYTGTLVSTLGIFAIIGHQFPASAIVQALHMFQIALVLDIFTTHEEILWKVSGFFMCQALTQPPDVYYAASLGIYALAPTYYVLGSGIPAVYWPFIQGLLHIAQMSASITYLVSRSLTIYIATLHIVFLTISTYEFGRWVSRIRAV